jgi:MYXO-CTERM domain-containing protein
MNLLARSFALSTVLLAALAALSFDLAGSALAADTWTTPQPGVKLLARIESGATPQRIHAAVVEVCKDGMHARATTYEERGKRTSTWAKSVDAIVAVNGSFFNYSGYEAIGWSIGDGQTWPNASAAGQAAIGFASYGRARIFDKSGPFPPPSFWRELVPSHPLLLDDGTIVQEACFSHFCERHPRTAVGISKDQKQLWLVAVDGRTSVAKGMTRLELAALMQNLGAYRALNFDGGGSTTLYVKGLGVVNSPSDGSERVVSSHLGFTVVPGEKGCCSYEPVAGATGTFGDVADKSWVKPYAEALFAADVTSGCQESPHLFCPDCTLDRATLGVFVAKAMGLTPVLPTTFADVPAGAWYAGYVEALKQAGVTSGCGGGAFCPDRLATRYEAAAFVWRGMGLPAAPATGTFSDLTTTQASVVEALAHACVVSGCAADAFCPDEDVTRAQVAKLVAVGFSVGGFGPCTQSGSGGAGGGGASASTTTTGAGGAASTSTGTSIGGGSAGGLHGLGGSGGSLGAGGAIVGGAAAASPPLGAEDASGAPGGCGCGVATDAPAGALAMALGLLAVAGRRKGRRP